MTLFESRLVRSLAAAAFALSFASCAAETSTGDEGSSDYAATRNPAAESEGTTSDIGTTQAASLGQGGLRKVMQIKDRGTEPNPSPWIEENGGEPNPSPWTPGGNGGTSGGSNGGSNGGGGNKSRHHDTPSAISHHEP